MESSVWNEAVARATNGGAPSRDDDNRSYGITKLEPTKQFWELLAINECTSSSSQRHDSRECLCICLPNILPDWINSQRVVIKHVCEETDTAGYVVFENVWPVVTCWQSVWTVWLSISDCFVTINNPSSSMRKIRHWLLTRLPSKAKAQMASGQRSHWLIESPTFCHLRVTRPPEIR